MTFQINNIQKIGVIISVIVILGGLFLHDPFEGYITTYYSGSELRRRNRRPIPDYLMSSINFWNWRSIGCKSKYVAEINDILSLVFMVSVFCVTWLIIFRDEKRE